MKLSTLFKITVLCSSHVHCFSHEKNNPFLPDYGDYDYEDKYEYMDEYASIPTNTTNEQPNTHVNVPSLSNITKTKEQYNNINNSSSSSSNPLDVTVISNEHSVNISKNAIDKNDSLPIEKTVNADSDDRTPTSKRSKFKYF